MIKFIVVSLLASASSFALARDFTDGVVARISVRRIGPHTVTSSGVNSSANATNEFSVKFGYDIPIDHAVGARFLLGGANYGASYASGNVYVTRIPVEASFYAMVNDQWRLGASLLTSPYQRIQVSEGGANSRLQSKFGAGFAVYAEYKMKSGGTIEAGYTRESIRAEGSGVSYRADSGSLRLATGFRFN